MKVTFLRVKDRDGVQHMLRPGIISRLSEALPPNDPPSVFLFTDDGRTAIQVMGTLDNIFQQLEQHL